MRRDLYLKKKNSTYIPKDCLEPFRRELKSLGFVNPDAFLDQRGNWYLEDDFGKYYRADESNKRFAKICDLFCKKLHGGYNVEKERFFTFPEVFKMSNEYLKRAVPYNITMYDKKVRIAETGKKCKGEVNDGWEPESVKEIQNLFVRAFVVTVLDEIIYYYGTVQYDEDIQLAYNNCKNFEQYKKARIDTEKGNPFVFKNEIPMPKPTFRPNNSNRLHRLEKALGKDGRTVEYVCHGYIPKDYTFYNAPMFIVQAILMVLSVVLVFKLHWNVLFSDILLMFLWFLSLGIPFVCLYREPPLDEQPPKKAKTE